MREKPLKFRNLCALSALLVTASVATAAVAQPSPDTPSGTNPAPGPSTARATTPAALPEGTVATPPPSPSPAPPPSGSEAAPDATSAELAVAPATPEESDSPAPVDDIASDEPAAPKGLSVGKEGTLQFGALLQFWAFASILDDETATTFRLRRAELKAFGEIVPESVAYKLMLDAAKVLESKGTEVPVVYEDEVAGDPATVTVPTPGDKLSVLQDFSITFLSDYADVSVGQFKNGLSLEGMTSSAKLMFPERSPVSRTYGDRRDLGVAAEKTFDHFRYFVGIFNGTGLNLRDTNNQKDLALRLEVMPLKGLTFGAVGYGSLGERDQATTKDRAEVDAKLELADFVVQAEYIRGWDGPADAAVAGHGFYGALGYTFFDKLQPVVRAGQLDVDLGSNGTALTDELTHIDFGLNYYLRGQEARLSASASVFAFDTEPTQIDLILLAQASF